MLKTATLHATNGVPTRPQQHNDVKNKDKSHIFIKAWLPTLYV